ncbi:hypothetical protein ACOT81_05905 [Streptomyces sp. WI04-05B]|uniref:hypothetical protein n=1 Tax=Streptomyces TaxID=1883 RepID=UPI0029B2C651|nr:MULTISPECIES: hypothetical protein [unclassified Streptomyces]MDX2545132.1 hypothetical protein [Streptomyces sp. WI04-05B]MDX2587623.1 hypothetical protein [Streptomyces sp. WI04-05A]MDX3748197.1 hypothetical protein [Streptomyces sp. AK08-02]
MVRLRNVRCGRRTPSAAFAPAICAPSRSGNGCRPGGRYQFSGYQERCQGAFLIAAERTALRIIDVYVHRPLFLDLAVERI